MQYMLDLLHVSAKMLKPVLLICFHIQTSLSLTTNKLIYQGTSIHLNIYIRVTFFLSLIVPFMKLGQLIGLNMHFTDKATVWNNRENRKIQSISKLQGDQGKLCFMNGLIVWFQTCCYYAKFLYHPDILKYIHIYKIN